MGSCSSCLIDINQGRIEFYPNAKNPRCEAIHLDNSQLRDVIDQVDRESIDQIEIYWSPLSGYQLTAKLVYHTYVVLKTASGGYYSIERSGNVVHIQKSDTEEAVREKFLCEKRSQLLADLFCRQAKPIVKAKGKGTVKDIANLLVEELQIPYNLGTNNCKHMSKRIFDLFNADGKEWL